MRKIALLLLSVLSLLKGTEVCAQTGVCDVNGDGDVDNVDVVCLVNKILGITSENSYHYDVNDDKKVDISDLTTVIAAFADSTRPNVYVMDDGIGAWNQMWVSGNGNLMAIKYKNGNEEILEKVATVVSENETGTVHSALFEFNDDGTPKSMLIDNNLIMVRRLYDNMASLTIVLADGTVLNYGNTPLSNSLASRIAIRRQEFAIQGMLEGVGEILTGLIISGAGGTCAYVAAHPTPLSPYLAATAVSLLAGGAATIYDGYNKLVAAVEENTERFNDTAGNAFLEKAAGNIQVLDPDFVFEEPSEKKNSILRFWDKISDFAEQLRIRALEAEEYMEGIEGCVFADRPIKVSEESATLAGRFSSNDYFDSSSACVAGFAVYPAGSSNYKLVTVDGSTAFSATVNGLTPATKYEYRAFFQDTHHLATVWSEPMEFTTVKVTTGNANLKLDKSFELNGSIIGTSNAKSEARVWFVYSTENKDPQLGLANCNQIFVTETKQDGDYSVPLTAIEVDKTYYYRIVLEIDGVDYNGEVKSFGIKGFMGLTYEPLGNISMSDGTIIVEYKIKTRFRPNDLQSEPGVVLMQGGQVLTKYRLTMEEAGADIDLYSGKVLLGVEKEDLNIDYEKMSARSKDLYLAPCCNMEVEGKTMMMVFNETQVNFDIIYNDQPAIIFSTARTDGAPIISVNSNGKNEALTTCYYEIGVIGAFWMKKATFKSYASSSLSWSLPSDEPFETLIDGYMPEYPRLIRVEYTPGKPTNDLSLQSYFAITIPYGRVIESVNHLEYQNNGYYITDVRIVPGPVGSRIVANEKVSTNLSERWREAKTISQLKKRANEEGEWFSLK